MKTAFSIILLAVFIAVSSAANAADAKAKVETGAPMTEKEAVELNKENFTLFNQALKSNDIKVFYNNIAPSWKAKLTPERMRVVFDPMFQIRNQVNFDGAVNNFPATAKFWQDGRKTRVITDIPAFDSAGHKMDFTLRCAYVFEEGKYRIAGIQLDIVSPPEPPAAAASPVSRQPVANNQTPQAAPMPAAALSTSTTAAKAGTLQQASGHTFTPTANSKNITGEQAAALNKKYVELFDAAIKSNNIKPFYDSISPSWKAQVSPEQLRQIFDVYFTHQIDFGDALKNFPPHVNFLQGQDKITVINEMPVKDASGASYNVALQCIYIWNNSQFELTGFEFKAE